MKLKKKEKNPIIKRKLTPEINTVAVQLKINNIDCPRSGWSINNIITEDNNKKLNVYLKFELRNFSEVKIFTEAKIKKGFNTSIGCNLKR